VSITINTIASDITTLYDQGLLHASYGGVGFYVIDGSDEPGRRILRFLFPGQDASAFQDLGQLDGEIELKGMLIGDDYIAQAQRMRGVCYTPGPQTLTHPWLGEIQVVPSPGRKPKFNFSQDMLRVASFSMCVLRYTPAQPPAISTLQSLLNAVEDTQLAVDQFLAATLAPAVLTLAAIGMVQGYVNLVAAEWTVLTNSAADAAVQPAAVAPIAAMGTVATVTVDANYGANVAGLLGGVPAAIAGTSAPIMPAAVAPGGSTATPVAVDPRVTATAILAVLPTMVPAATAAAPGPALSLAAQALALSYAVQAASDIQFSSQQEASAWFSELATPLAAAATLAASLVPTQATAAGTLWRALVALQAALAADMTATIGRLPAVETLTLGSPAPLWLIAQYLVGDTPGLVLPTYLDLLQRNDVINPAVPPPGPLEVLVQ
jgi:prophage DNA circulation protein